MTTNGSAGNVSTENGLVTASLAMLAGIIVLGTGVYFVTILEAPIGPPVEAAPLFVWTTTAAVMAFVLLRRGHPLGYPAGIVTGLLVVTAMALIGSGAYEPVGASSSPLGPLSYLALGLGVIATTVAAWRRRPDAGDAPNTAASAR